MTTQLREETVDQVSRRSALAVLIAFRTMPSAPLRLLADGDEKATEAIRSCARAVLKDRGAS